MNDKITRTTSILSLAIHFILLVGLQFNLPKVIRPPEIIAEIEIEKAPVLPKIIEKQRTLKEEHKQIEPRPKPQPIESSPKPQPIESPPEPQPIEPHLEPQPIESHPVESSDGNSTVGNVSSAAPSDTDTAAVIETEFGLAGAPAFLKREMPIYPMMARRLGKEGKVVLRLFIDEKGKLLDVEVVEEAGYGFTESALEAVKKSTFLPAHKNGVSAASKALLTIRFVLQRM